MVYIGLHVWFVTLIMPTFKVQAVDNPVEAEAAAQHFQRVHHPHRGRPVRRPSWQHGLPRQSGWVEQNLTSAPIEARKCNLPPS